MCALLWLGIAAAIATGAARQSYPKKLPPPAAGSGRVFRLAAGSAPPLQLSSKQLAVSLDPALPRVIEYTFLPTNESFAAAVHGWGYHPSVKLNGGAVTCGEAGMSTTYTRASTSAINWTLTMSCAFNYPTIIAADEASAPAGPVTVVMQGSISLVDEAALSPKPPPAAAAVQDIYEQGVEVAAGTGALCSGTIGTVCDKTAQDPQVFPEPGSGIQILAPTAAECCALCANHTNCT